MKTSTFTLALLLSTLICNANHMLSQLNLKIFDNSDFTVILDNQPSYVESNNFNFKNITPGIHRIKVIKRRHGHHYGQGNYGNQNILYNGTINIPAGKDVYAIIDYYHQLNIINQTPTCLSAQNNGYNNYSNYYPTNYNNTYNYTYAPACMTDASFNNLIHTIANASFDSQKLQIAVQAVSKNGITSNQVLSIMNQLTFESNKLSFAKQAYQFTIDKHNYFIVNNGFTFSSSINTLNEFVCRY